MNITSPSGIYTCAPGSVVTITGTGFGTSGTLTLPAQGASKTVALVLTPSTYTDTKIVFTIPDGALTDTLAISGASGTATVPLRIVSQYVSAAEYASAGEGANIASLAPGELDSILQKASAMADVIITVPLRYMQTLESYRWVGHSRRLYPRRWPIQSVDGLKVVVANALYANFNPNDIVVDADARYVEVLQYAVANFVLFGAIENIGLSANIAQLTYTHGYKQLDYPDPLRQAVIMIATELLTNRNIQAQGFGGFSTVKQGNQEYDRRSESFAIPKPALDLLQPYRTLRIQ